jgi:hypothetical protein
MNKDDLKGKAENLKERAKEAAESIGKGRPSDGAGRAASASDRGSPAQGAKSAAGDGAGSRRPDKKSEAIESEDVESASGDIDREVEESEDE